MPMPDLTVDTNVLMHACNPNEDRFNDAVLFLTTLLAATTKLALDDGFALDLATNRSLIGAEYLQKLVPGSLASSVVATMALHQRVAIHSSTLPAQDSRKLNQMVANRRDRTFIKVCANSAGKALVSHDFLDFPRAKRKDLSKCFGIEMFEACTAVPLL
jgi:hypothetical protein